MLKLTLLRVKYDKEFTTGILFNTTTGNKLCDILEDTTRDINADGDLDDLDEGKIYGKTSIPFGTYDIEVTYSPKFNMDMVLIKGVPHFTGIRMHWGATIEQSEGCPLMGELHFSNRTPYLKNTGMTKRLVKLLLENNNKGKVEIK